MTDEQLRENMQAYLKVLRAQQGYQKREAEYGRSVFRSDLYEIQNVILSNRFWCHGVSLCVCAANQLVIVLYEHCTMQVRTCTGFMTDDSVQNRSLLLIESIPSSPDF